MSRVQSSCPVVNFSTCCFGIYKTAHSRGRQVPTAFGAAAAVCAHFSDTMLQFLLGFTLGNVVGMYLAQNYDIPNLAKKLEEIKKDVDAKKKPPSC